MSSIPHSLGIYQWRCSSNGRVYVGSAVNLYQRYYDHLKTLRANRHANAHLQHAWNKYGEQDFSFTILEVLMFPEDLIVREQHWMDRLGACDKRTGFNIAPRAGSTLGVPSSLERKQKISATKEHVWEGFIDPDGDEVTIVNLRKFCLEHGLDCATMHRLYHGGKNSTLSHLGWTHRNCEQRKRAAFQRKNTPYEGIVGPDGTRYPPISNLSAFCREHGVAVSGLNQLYLYNKPYKGWTCVRPALRNETRGL